MSGANTQTIVARDQARIAGVQKHCMSQTSILVAGTAYAPTAVIQVYQADLSARQAVSSAKAAYAAALAKAKAAEDAATTFDASFKMCIEGAYAGQPAVLADFGITLPKRRSPSATVKAAAADKAQITRKARGIMGARQRAQIPPATLPASSSATTASAGTVEPVTPAVGAAVPVGASATTPGHAGS
jgi:hypothetical protein